MGTGFFFGKYLWWRESLITHAVVGPNFLTLYTLHAQTSIFSTRNCVCPVQPDLVTMLYVCGAISIICLCTNPILFVPILLYINIYLLPNNYFYHRSLLSVRKRTLSNSWDKWTRVPWGYGAQISRRHLMHELTMWEEPAFNIQEVQIGFIWNMPTLNL